jgi:hypothetical protein
MTRRQLALLLVATVVAGCAHSGSGAELAPGRLAVRTASAVLKERLSACEAQDADACAKAAMMKADGFGGPPDMAAAMKLYEQSCALDSDRGCGFVAQAHWDGKLVAADISKAVELFERACDLGWTPACTTLAEKLARADKLPRDAARAGALLARACEMGDDFACTARLELAGSGAWPETSERRGCLSQRDVLASLAPAASQAKYCYERELARDGSLCGKVVTRFVVAADGSVDFVDITASSMHDEIVETCLATLVSGLRFRACTDGGTAQITYPWIFKVGPPPGTCARDPSL